jgi:hypothetical protein
MHHVEGAQCGLPLLYHLDGGGIVEAGERYGIGFRDDVVAAIDALRVRYAEFHARVRTEAPSGDRMVQAYVNRIASLVAQENEPERRGR